ncbi:hypothetical protein L9F63_023845 [Diploptera punctata]|uniref:START domain-containing protein n=1 Tax=Diploptera punctata TaxID=6984 RepID=A0AAD7ZHV7_DIPPU|nr:hypothetical protein L9F63_023845 [Diploptera punctata]
MKFFSGNRNENCKVETPGTFSDEEYKDIAKRLFERGLDINNSTDNWKLEKTNSNGDTVESKYLPGVGKVFRLTAEVNFPPKKLLSEIFYNVESITRWNTSLLISKRIKMIGDDTDLVHQVTAPVAGGLVKSRDFVAVRHYENRQGCYVAAGGSVEHPDLPENSQYIRGVTGPGCQISKSIPGVADRCIFQWTMNSRLNGWLPQYLVDMASAEFLFTYIKNVRSYGDKLREQGLMDE